MPPRKKGLAPSIIKQQTSLKKVDLDQDVLEEFKAYIEWVGIQSLDEGIEKAIAYVLADDSDWSKHKKSLTKAKTVKPAESSKQVAEEVEKAVA